MINDKNHFVGFADIRHRFIPQNANWGGNIGLFLRPSERGKGIGKDLLRLALAHAHSIGLDSIVICCHHKNIPSKQTIEMVMQENGGAPLPDGQYKDTCMKRFCLKTTK